MSHPRARLHRTGRIGLLATALGLTLAAGFANPAWAGTGSASAQGQANAAQHQATSAVAAAAAKAPKLHTSNGVAAAKAPTLQTPSGSSDGSLSLPQPISTADANLGGANGQCPGGPYCSTRDGSPSGNGNGNGAALGKPCAGCVGKADNKNPAGQMPDGSDHNAGYECDTNHGIGRTNPAHTGCTPAPTSGCVATATQPCDTGSGGCVATATQPCAGTSGCVETVGHPCETGSSSGCVATAVHPCTSPHAGALAESQTRNGVSASSPATSAALASTGTDVAWLLAVGLILIGLGSVALFTGASANGASGSIKRRWPALALRRGV